MFFSMVVFILVPLVFALVPLVAIFVATTSASFLVSATTTTIFISATFSFFSLAIFALLVFCWNNSGRNDHRRRGCCCFHRSEAFEVRFFCPFRLALFFFLVI